MGLLIGGAIIIAAAMWIYFSPTQMCIRAEVDRGIDRDVATIDCSKRH